MGMNGNLPHPPPGIAHYKTCQQVVTHRKLGSHTAFLFAPYKHRGDGICMSPQTHGGMRNKIKPADSLFHRSSRTSKWHLEPDHLTCLGAGDHLPLWVVRCLCSTLCHSLTSRLSAQVLETPQLWADGPPASGSCPLCLGKTFWVFLVSFT